MRSLLYLSPENKMFRKDTVLVLTELASIKEVVGGAVHWEQKRRYSKLSWMSERSFARNPA